MFPSKVLSKLDLITYNFQRDALSLLLASSFQPIALVKNGNTHILHTSLNRYSWLWKNLSSLDNIHKKKKETWLPKVSWNKHRAPVNSSCHPLQRETAWRGFVDATDISLIERTAVEGGWQVLKRFCLGGRIKNRLGLKIQLLPPLRVKGSCGVSGALYLFRCEVGMYPLWILFKIRLSEIRLKVTLMMGQ